MGGRFALSIATGRGDVRRAGGRSALSITDAAGVGQFALSITDAGGESSGGRSALSIATGRGDVGDNMGELFAGVGADLDSVGNLH